MIEAGLLAIAMTAITAITLLVMSRVFAKTWFRRDWYEPRPLPVRRNGHDRQDRRN
ncbi:MAG: hypothetical protein ROR55_18245 [Devosia sp.]